MMTPSQPQTDDIRRDLQATLAARREMGPEYDEHFLNALVEKLQAGVQRQVASMPRPPAPSDRLSRDQRTGIAICSLIFGIPLIAIASNGGPFYFFGMLVAIVLLNLIAAR